MCSITVLLLLLWLFLTGVFTLSADNDNTKAIGMFISFCILLPIFVVIDVLGWGVYLISYLW